MVSNTRVVGKHAGRSLQTDLVQRIVVESGNPEGFNAEAWLQEWPAAPLPAFENRRPWDVLQEPEGLALIQTTLLQIQKGSFA